MAQSSTTEARSDSGSTPRVETSVPVAAAVFTAYVVAFIGVTSTAGIAYDEWFATSANAYRTAVLGLAVASLVLVAFLVWARWDFVWRDPERLPMPTMLKVVVGLHVLGVIASFATRDWATAMDVLVPVILAGILVGFAEEMMFRGIILRSLRTDMRPEFRVALFSSLWFGLFHLTNLLNGAPTAAIVFQVVNATLAGAVLYAVRRYAGALVLGMVVHGLWDIGVFLPVNDDMAGIAQAVPFAGAVVAGIIALVVLRRDRDITVTRQGITHRGAGDATSTT